MEDSTTPPLKRQREEVHVREEDEEQEALKRQKSYKEILSILEEDDDEPDQDLSSHITTLQREISSSRPSSSCPASSSSSENSSSSSRDESPPCHFDHPQLTSSCPETDPSVMEISSLRSSSNPGAEDQGEEEKRERVMRHLLEASDDELGIPNTEEEGGRVVVDEQEVDVQDISGGDPFIPFGGEGLWEIEDEVANYYTLLQSELFM